MSTSFMIWWKRLGPSSSPTLSELQKTSIMQSGFQTEKTRSKYGGLSAQQTSEGHTEAYKKNAAGDGSEK